MTYFLQVVSRHTPFSAATILCRDRARQVAGSDAQRDEAEYQAVFGLVGALLAGGLAVVLTALASGLS
jgi:hypothetical protein